MRIKKRTKCVFDDFDERPFSLMVSCAFFFEITFVSHCSAYKNTIASNTAIAFFYKLCGNV